MNAFVTDRSFAKVAPRRVSDVTVIAKIRHECGLDLETVPGYGSEDSSHLQFKLAGEPLQKPVQITRNFLRWLMPNLGCDAAAVVRTETHVLIAFGKIRGNGIDFGGAHFGSSMRKLSIRTAIAQVGNSFFCEGQDRIIYPAIVLGTPNVILPR